MVPTAAQTLPLVEESPSGRPQLDRTVAIKVLPEAFAADTERVARFEREAKTLASLNHPHIAAIYGLEDADPSPGSGQAAVKALVMELVEAEKPRVWSETPVQLRPGTGASFDLHPDGERVAMAPGTAATPSPTHVTLIFNFFDELRRLAPAGRR